MKRCLIIVLLLITTSNSYSQINTIYVSPILTNNNYEAVQDSHMVVRNTSTNNDKLFLFLGGTGSKPRQYVSISNFVGRLGYDVINLSYNNSVAAVSLANDPDSLVFNKFRSEVCYGTPVSPDVNVDSLNSIYSRTVNLLNYLVTTFPTQNWEQYLDDSNTLKWSKIAIGGHSQGSGHACYFGKLNFVERVLMFSGPNDYSTYYSRAAPWLEEPGKTELNRHFAYLSLLDEVVDFDQQLSNLQSLNLYPTYDTTFVDKSIDSFSNSHCLYTTQTPGLFTILNHNTPIQLSAINANVWTYMLSAIIPTGIERIDEDNLLSVYPNPTGAFVNIIGAQNFLNKSFSVFDMKGQLIMTRKINNLRKISVDLNHLAGGCYLIKIDNQVLRILKH